MRQVRKKGNRDVCLLSELLLGEPVFFEQTQDVGFEDLDVHGVDGKLLKMTNFSTPVLTCVAAENLILLTVQDTQERTADAHPETRSLSLTG